MVNTQSPDIAASSLALQTINTEWPIIKESLLIKRSVDAAFKSAAEHREELPPWKVNKKEKERDFIQHIKAEHDAASEYDLSSRKWLESIKHKYDILEDNMAILLRDYRKASSGVESVQASYRTLTKARCVYDEARINLPNFVYAKSLLTNARLDGERIRVKLIDEYSGAWYEINEISPKHPTKNDFYVDPKAERDAIYTSNVVDKKISQAFDLVPTLPAHTAKSDTIDPNGPAALSRSRQAIVTQNAVYRIDDMIDNIAVSIAYLESKMSLYRSDLVVQKQLVRAAVKDIWTGILGRLGCEMPGEVGDIIDELGLSLRAFLEC
ncbi:hypothetical protein BC829DRAFT_442593 [Chytridium lagenaria]|nr:hypothetical protein BC829DRAFT_442593 [Chytridium lagenaria]